MCVCVCAFHPSAPRQDVGEARRLYRYVDNDNTTNNDNRIIILLIHIIRLLHVLLLIQHLRAEARRG